MFKRKTLITAALLISALGLGSTAHAERLAYQFVCHDNGSAQFTGWLDERVSMRTMFERPKSGERYWYCRSDCHPDYGIRRCSFVVPSEEGNWDPWVQRRDGISCDKLCLRVRAVDGQLNYPIARSDTDITRYRVTYSSSSRTLPWTPHSHTSSSNVADTRSTHFSGGVRDGYTFCWDGSWGTDFWAALYGAPGTSGRMTEVLLTDGDNVRHTFRVLGYYDSNAGW